VADDYEAKTRYRGAVAATYRQVGMQSRQWRREFEALERFLDGVAPGERITVVVGLSSEGGSRDHRPAARADVHRLAAQRGQEVGQPGLAHPVAQIQGTAAPNQQSVNLLDGSRPMLFFDAGQGGELEHSQRLPTQTADVAGG